MIELLDDALKLKNDKITDIQREKFSIVGDIHGDYVSLKKITDSAHKPVIFLGDYGDRGEMQIEVYEEILRGYIDGEYILIRGNHETTTAFPHDLPHYLERFDNWEDIYLRIQKFWGKLPWCGIINNTIFVVHGGIYTKNCRITEEGIKFSELESEEAFLEMIWNDPWEKEGCSYNYERGIGFFFGKNVTERFLNDLDLKVVIRGHQPYKILKVEHDGKVVTVGSTTVYGTNCAFLKIEGSFEDGYDIVKKYGYVFD